MSARACDVHRIVLGDTEPRASSRYCPACRAWICDECRSRVSRRFVAALMRAAGLGGEVAASVGTGG